MDLRNSDLPNQVVFDNTAIIPEQDARVRSIVLKAAPVEGYRLPPAELVDDQSSSMLAGGQARNRSRSGTQAYPVSSSKTLVPDRGFDFRPLPTIPSVVADYLLEPDSVDSQVEDIYGPDSFPSAEVDSVNRLRKRQVNEFALPHAQSRQGSGATTTQSEESSPTVSSRETQPEKRPAKIILRAVPSKPIALEPAAAPTNKGTNARFKFGSPK